MHAQYPEADVNFQTQKKLYWRLNATLLIYAFVL